MCKHILNAQVAIRAPCCRRFFDCPQCHAEAVGSEHKLAKTTEMQMVCKKCRRAFRKDLARFEHEDEFCPHCDNHFVIDAQTPAPALDAEEKDGADAGENADLRNVDPSLTEALDPRVRYDPRRDWLAVEASQKEDAARIDEGGVAGAMMDRQARERRMVAAAKQINALQQQQQQAAGASVNDDDLDWS